MADEPPHGELFNHEFTRDNYRNQDIKEWERVFEIMGGKPIDSNDPGVGTSLFFWGVFFMCLFVYTGSIKLGMIKMGANTEKSNAIFTVGFLFFVILVVHTGFLQTQPSGTL